VSVAPTEGIKGVTFAIDFLKERPEKDPGKVIKPTP